MDTVGSYTAQCHVDNIGIFKDEELKEDVICGSHNIGADDKCGIAIAMELYEKYPERFSLLFTVQEESGGGGVKEFIKNNPDLLAKVNYCVIADRKGSEDIIGADNDYCSKEFETRVTEALLMYGYSPNVGVRCDADYLSDHMNCINLSCGYYNAHSNDEFVVVREFMNAYNAIEHLSSVFNEKMAKPDKNSFGGTYGRYGTFGPETSYHYDLIEVYGDEMSVNKDVIMYTPNGDMIKLPKGDYYFMKDGEDDAAADELQSMVGPGRDPDEMF